MQTYQEYVTASPSDVRWGVYLVDAGISHVRQHSRRSIADHPDKYRFTWETGRTLQEYQLIYLAQGAGSFESSESPLEQVREGASILLFPGVWHRYRPDPSTGWTTYWVGFRGAFADHLVREGFFDPPNPVLEIGYVDDIVRLFQDVQETLRSGRPGFQYVAGSAVMLILAHIQAHVKSRPFHGKEIEFKIDRARMLFVESVEDRITPEEVAEQLNISYSWFRKMFKEYTGTSPGQYQLQLRLQRSRDLLANPSTSIKEVAFQLGFSSQSHFTRTFRDKMGITPGIYRQKVLGT